MSQYINRISYCTFKAVIHLCEGSQFVGIENDTPGSLKAFFNRFFFRGKGVGKGDFVFQNARACTFVIELKS